MSYREFYQEDSKSIEAEETLKQAINTDYSVNWTLDKEAYTRGLKSEQINHPSHYTRGPIECIEAQKSMLSPAEYKGYLKGCAMAYLWREMHKGGVDDVKKAQWFLDRLAETYSNGGATGLGDKGDTLNPKAA